MSTHVDPCQSMSIHVNPYQPMSTYVNPCQLMSTYVNPCQLMTTYVNSCQLMSTHVDPFPYRKRFTHFETICMVILRCYNALLPYSLGIGANLFISLRHETILVFFSLELVLRIQPSYPRVRSSHQWWHYDPECVPDTNGGTTTQSTFQSL
jgi:hypothetical protein